MKKSKAINAMREIKFRAKGSKTGEWVYGYLVPLVDIDKYTGKVVLTDDFGIVQRYGDDDANNWRNDRIEKETVGQCTGLEDVDGKDIYEGDIVQPMYHAAEGRGKGKAISLKPSPCPPKVVSYRHGAFGYVNTMVAYDQATENWDEEWLPMLDHDYKVIGNVYDNPELLKQ